VILRQDDSIDWQYSRTTLLSQIRLRRSDQYYILYLFQSLRNTFIENIFEIICLYKCSKTNSSACSNQVIANKIILRLLSKNYLIQVCIEDWRYWKFNITIFYDSRQSWKITEKSTIVAQYLTISYILFFRVSSTLFRLYKLTKTINIG